MAGRVYLFDANAIIEAVRTGVWNALTGALNLQTVATCAAECRQGDRLSSEYVVVSEEDLGRIAAIHAVSDTDIASILLMAKAEALDAGELELFAHAVGSSGSELSLICSPDLASVKFAVTAGIGDRLVSLEDAVTAVGANPQKRLRPHFMSAWLSRERTKAILGTR